MGTYRILLFFFLMPSLVWANSLAERTCLQEYENIVEGCQTFSFDNGEHLVLGRDRTDVELDNDIGPLSSQSQYLFSGDRCNQADNFHSQTIIFKNRNSAGDQQCVVWRAYTNGAGQRMVEETIYRGENRTHLQNFSEETFRERPRDPEVILNHPDHDSFLNRVGRFMNPVFDAVGLGSGSQSTDSEPVER